jgi:hypothetical protein
LVLLSNLKKEISAYFQRKFNLRLCAAQSRK